jgi:hypothetical protein
MMINMGLQSQMGVYPTLITTRFMLYFQTRARAPNIRALWLMILHTHRERRRRRNVHAEFRVEHCAERERIARMIPTDMVNHNNIVGYPQRTDKCQCSSNAMPSPLQVFTNSWMYSNISSCRWQVLKARNLYASTAANVAKA